MGFNECAKTLTDSGGRALGALISRFKEFRDLSFKTFMTIFNSGVQPILTYGSSVWGMKTYKDIDKIYNRACRYYLGTHKFTLFLQCMVKWVSYLLFSIDKLML